MNFDCGQNPKPGDPWDILGKETKEMHKEIKWQGFPTSSWPASVWAASFPKRSPYGVLPINLTDTLAHVT